MSKKNTWFDETFLPSLFERPRVDGGFVWLSEKQVDCFIRQNGVKERQLLTQNIINGGFYVFGSVFEYVWCGRELDMFLCKNGKGRLYFGQTESEKNRCIAEQRKKEDSRAFESAKRMKEKRPNKFAEEFEKATKNLLLAIQIFDASAASENDTDFEDDLFELEEAEKRYYRYYFA